MHRAALLTITTSVDDEDASDKRRRYVSSHIQKKIGREQFSEIRTVWAAMKAIDTEKEWNFHSEFIVTLKVPYYTCFWIIN